MVDGAIVACVSEERFSRKKNDDAYPRRAIEYCLKAAGLRAAELDLVAFAGERFDPTWVLCHRSAYTIGDRLREQREVWYPRMYEQKHVDYLEVFRDKVDVAQYPGRRDEVMAFLRNGGSSAEPSRANQFFQRFRRDTVARHLEIDPGRVVFPHHHRSHAYYAFFGSPCRQDTVLVLTADAWGDDMNASVSVAEGGRVRVLSTSTNFEVARLYRSMTLLLGMKPDEHEYKIMGLAPYAKPQYLEEPLAVFRETQHVDGLGFGYTIVPPDRYVYYQKKLEGYRFDAVAGALQRYTEEILSTWTRNALAATGARHACVGGGIAMNVKAMMELARLPGLESIFVCPSPSDESLAMGACYAAYYDRLADGQSPRDCLRPLAHSYLGPPLDDDDVRSAVGALAAEGGYAIRERFAATDAAALLASGRIVGRCAGRSEFGARALGNRSILADPRDPLVVSRLNATIKSRDFWMPFAPSILEERATDYLVNVKRLAAPYMTIAFDTTLRAHRDLRAALHPADLTARPQIVSREANGAYHELLRAFEQLTGVGGVLNTSFNLHGEPIVQTAADAVDVLRRSDLDALILGDVLIEKQR